MWTVYTTEGKTLASIEVKFNVSSAANRGNIGFQTKTGALVIAFSTRWALALYKQKKLGRN